MLYPKTRRSRFAVGYAFVKDVTPHRMWLRPGPAGRFQPDDSDDSSADDCNVGQPDYYYYGTTTTTTTSTY